MQCRKTHFVKEKLYSKRMFSFTLKFLYLFGIEKSISKMYLINAAIAYSWAML